MKRTVAFVALVALAATVTAIPAMAGKDPTGEDFPALFLGGAYVESENGILSGWGMFPSGMVLDVMLVFSAFGPVDAPMPTAGVTVTVQGKTATGEKLKRTFTGLTTAEEVIWAALNLGTPVDWITIGRLPAGWYRVKVKVKGVKPTKVGGKADFYLAIFDD